MAIGLFGWISAGVFKSSRTASEREYADPTLLGHMDPRFEEILNHGRVAARPGRSHQALLGILDALAFVAAVSGSYLYVLHSQTHETSKKQNLQHAINVFCTRSIHDQVLGSKHLLAGISSIWSLRPSFHLDALDRACVALRVVRTQKEKQHSASSTRLKSFTRSCHCMSSSIAKAKQVVTLLAGDAC